MRHFFVTLAFVISPLYASLHEEPPQKTIKQICFSPSPFRLSGVTIRGHLPGAQRVEVVNLFKQSVIIPLDHPINPWQVIETYFTDRPYSFISPAKTEQLINGTFRGSVHTFSKDGSTGPMKMTFL